ncbi:hypothetical protein OW492_02315 [Psychromonas sp. 14N.309.X.WAT.B.A12]|uniref:hypothetical protein n=1 Tax=Psychromonas sp. 14N.309.X.WAT.B.A12 TaxID=2998322 RepID=UPI0025B1677D|nr:hypothetical protein [Psychromonas sp. 14N.309.X.WAT.B.A12]MDN2662210.1 hypothetical protein [Psychromonas sp. 14N.309.X.WAT.B.A12]
MSTITSAASSLQSLSSSLDSKGTATASQLLGENFENILSSEIQGKESLLTASTGNIKDSLEGVFNELKLGIATSFVAGLSGDDSATSTGESTDTAETDSTLEQATNTESSEALASDSEQDETTAEESELSALDIQQTADDAVDTLQSASLDSISIESETKNAISMLQEKLRESMEGK